MGSVEVNFFALWLLAYDTRELSHWICINFSMDIKFPIIRNRISLPYSLCSFEVCTVMRSVFVAGCDGTSLRFHQFSAFRHWHVLVQSIKLFYSQINGTVCCLMSLLNKFQIPVSATPQWCSKLKLHNCPETSYINWSVLQCLESGFVGCNAV
jgi:hypothetical protein